MRENGNNRINKGKDSISYPKIKENFEGWGRGPYLGTTQDMMDKVIPGNDLVPPCDWEGKHNLHQAACYRREKPICMKVRLHSSHPAPSFRSFTLQVDPIVKNGGGEELHLGAGRAG